jgi:hypothetical protein
LFLSPFYAVRTWLIIGFYRGETHKNLKQEQPNRLLICMPSKLDKGKKVVISLDEDIVRSDGSRIKMREFVKEMLAYNPAFMIETSPKGETWYLRKRAE